MKNYIFLLSLILLFNQAKSQYYYRDILNTGQLQKDILLMKEKNIREVSIKSFDSDGTPSEGFFCEKKISKDFRRTELFTRSDISSASLLTSLFDGQGRIVQITDSSKISVSYTHYNYNSLGKISSILTEVVSSDDDFHSEMKEEHIYFYDDNGYPTEMKRVKNGKDTILILFKTDDKGKVTIEKNSQTGSKYYYYYNDRQLLSDVVLSNEYKDKLVPQYSFEYNSNGQVTQMSNSAEGGGTYNVWKYKYDDGLRSAEKCYAKGRTLLGSVEYNYNP